MDSSSFKQVQKQTQQLSPHVFHSLKILQVPALELRKTILNELQSNPVLEDLSSELYSLDAKSSNLASESQQNEPTDTTDDPTKRQFFFDSITIEQSLQEHLMQQANLSGASHDELVAIEYLIGSLDDRGHLTNSLEEISRLCNQPLSVIEKSRELLKSFDPVGIACFNLQESLLTQLKANGRSDSLAAMIIQDHYSLLIRRRIPDIARKLKASAEDIQTAIKEIAILDPAPGRSFKADTNYSIAPDAFIEKIDNKWIIILNSEFIPRLGISKTYKSLMAKAHISAIERTYIKEKIRSGKLLIQAIEHRQNTLHRLIEALLHFQKDFFEHGIPSIHPLTLKEVAEYLGIHETTVSRAVANKYIRTPFGLFEFKRFFPSGVESLHGSSISSTALKDEIANIIATELPEKPFSDQKITTLLKEKNIPLARRTVAKYREELGILPTNLRRRYSGSK